MRSQGRRGFRSGAPRARQLRCGYDPAQGLHLIEIKAVPISSVARDLGIKLTRSGSAHCPLPDHADSEPSFSIRQATNRFRCFGCGHSGSVIDLVMLTLGLEFVEACRWLEGRYLGSRVVTPDSRPRLARPAPPAPAPAAIADPEVYASLLDQAPLQEAGRRYLNARGLGDVTLARFRVGQVRDAAKLVRTLAAAWGLDRLFACGLVGASRTPRLVFPSGYLLFPFLEEDRVTYLQARRADDGQKQRWLCLREVPPRLFNVAVLSDPSAGTIHLCEGITDVLSAAELGLAAIGILGAHAPLPEGWIGRLRGRNVVVVPDDDNSGRAFFARLQAELAACGLTVVRLRLPAGCNDLNDALLTRRGIR